MRILVFGDSIAAGFFDSVGGWVSRLRVHTNNRSVRDPDYYVTFYNLSISGDSSSDVVKRFESEIVARKWEDLELGFIYAIGVNDSHFVHEDQKMNVPLEKYKKNIERLIEGSKKYGKKIFFVGLTPVDDDLVNPMPWAPDKGYQTRLIREYDEALRDICEANNVDYIHLMDAFLKKDHTKLLQDGAHPNTEGHKLIYDTVFAHLEKVGIL